MVSKQTLVNNLPPFRAQKQLINPTQDTKDIEAQLLAVHKRYEADYDRIYKYFDTGDVYETSRLIWSFLKHNLIYHAESIDEQSSKSPSAILQPGENIDCKHYSLFAAGILDAIKRNTGDAWEWAFRFASDKSKKYATHVFVVVFDGNNEIWIDPVLTNFDQRKNWIYEKDVSPMALFHISGVDDEETLSSLPITVNDQHAFTSFLVMVGLNLAGLKDFLNRNMSVTNSDVRAYCQRMGYDFNQLLIILNS